MLRKLGAASCIPALAYNPARSMNCGSNAHSYRNSFYGVSSGSSRSACTDLLCKGVDKKGAWVAPAPSLGRKRPRSALQQSLAALQHIMNRLVGSRGVLPGRRTGWNGGTRILERGAPIWNRETGCGAEGTLS